MRILVFLNTLRVYSTHADPQGGLSNPYHIGVISQRVSLSHVLNGAMSSALGQKNKGRAHQKRRWSHPDEGGDLDHLHHLAAVVGSNSKAGSLHRESTQISSGQRDNAQTKRLSRDRRCC